MRAVVVLTAVALAALVPAEARAAEEDTESAKPEAELGAMSLEEMLNVEVTSVSKKAESAFTAPSAIYVITAEDIRRSGLTSIPELLRLVPGLEVARINSSNWAITSRGLNGQFSNKLLVLIDGRSVYNPLFAGTYWDVQDTLIEDIDRIEVIRGPGGTLWGANAVNGVINVITKSASKTQGALLFSGGGTEERAFGGGRWGGEIGEKFHYRAYMKYWDHGSFEMPNGADAQDGWTQARTGGRFDWDAWQNGTVTFLGDYYWGSDHSPPLQTIPQLTPPYTRAFVGNDAKENVTGGDVVARATHKFSDESDLQFQFYYDRFQRKERLTIQQDLGIKLDTVDLQFQHRFPLFWGQSLIWGTEYRRYSDDVRPEVAGRFNIGFMPPRRSYDIVSGFIQDQIPIIKDQLTFTAGTKLEYNDFSHFEYQPSARLAWQPHANHFVWGAVSRAVRTPSRVEENIDAGAVVVPIQPPVPTPFPVVGITRALGNHDFRSESLLSYELGYRVRPWSTASIDTAAFYNDYHHLATAEPTGRFSTPEIGNPIVVVIPTRFRNLEVGTTYGAETAFTWQALEPWRLTLNYTYLSVQIRKKPGSVANTEATEGTTPQHQVGLRSLVNLPFHLELDTMVYYYDRVPDVDVPAYVRFDARLGWRPVDQVEISVVGQNLAQSNHLEFNSGTLTVPSEVQRGVYGKVTFRF